MSAKTEGAVKSLSTAACLGRTSVLAAVNTSLSGTNADLVSPSSPCFLTGTKHFFPSLCLEYSSYFLTLRYIWSEMHKGGICSFTLREMQHLQSRKTENQCIHAHYFKIVLARFSVGTVLLLLLAWPKWAHMWIYTFSCRCQSNSVIHYNSNNYQFVLSAVLMSTTECKMALTHSQW